MAEKKCNQCTTKQPNIAEIPYVVFENAQARNERKDKRNLILILVLIFALLFSNMAWLWVFNQYDYSSYTVEGTQDGSGINIIGGGDIDYGAEGEDNSTQEN